MMRIQELVESIDALRREDLEIWISESIIRPTGVQDEPEFGEAECARVRLVCTLHYDMDVDIGTLPIVLDLIDQLHATHHRLRALGDAVLAQDEQIREAIMKRMKALR